jgi:predicted PurR-regulated permease PerM
MLDRTLALKLEKWAIWIVLIAIIFLLRHLFPIFFLTFVLSYIGSTAVNALTRRFPRRKLNVIVVYVFFLAILTGIGLLVVPRMMGETLNLARQYIVAEAARPEGPSENIINREARELVDGFIIGVAGNATFVDFRESDAYAMILTKVDGMLKRATARMVPALMLFGSQAAAFALQFLISVILSFLMIWDLPATRARIQRFAYGRTAEVYTEIAPGLTAFGVMLGRAFEAQSVVAVVNALLSFAVFVLLGLPSVALLAMVVFFCSYIPILGMIISTLPAAFLAFKVGGITHVLWLIAAILVIHAIEAYMLNPLIYGRHLRLHPIAVLVILLVAEHLFGVWGLLLGVPIAAFVLKYVIEGEPVVQPPVTALPAGGPVDAG